MLAHISGSVPLPNQDAAGPADPASADLTCAATLGETAWEYVRSWLGLRPSADREAARITQ